jgi:hypothetical protein
MGATLVPQVRRVNEFVVTTRIWAKEECCGAVESRAWLTQHYRLLRAARSFVALAL